MLKNDKIKMYRSTILNEKGQIILPIKIRRIFGLKKGIKLNIHTDKRYERVIILNRDKQFSIL